MRRRLARLSVARQVLLLQLALVLLLVVGGSTLAAVEAKQASQREARHTSLAVAQTLAHSPQVRDALTASHPSTVLQPIAESILRSADLDFVVMMSPQGIRYTHPNPAEIGGHFVGHIAPAVQGRAFTETYTGTLGPSVRAVVPVTGTNGAVIGLVSVGILEERISQVLGRQLPLIVLLGAVALLVAGLGAAAVSRRLRRQTLGLGPVEITRMFQHHDAVLHAIREGVVVVDQRRRLSLANDEAVRLLGLPADYDGRPVSGLDLDAPLRDLLESGRPARDELHVVGAHVVAVNQAPAVQDGRTVGWVTTLRDHTELQALTGELDSMRGFAEALRASAHESANRLHTVVTLIELGRQEEAVRFATAELATSQELTDRLLAAVGEPVLAALLLGKVSEARERGVELTVTGDTEVAGVPFDPSELVTLVGNLIDNAVDAALDGEPPRSVTATMRSADGELVVRVADSGRGVDVAGMDELFTRGWSTKRSSAVHGRGLGLALVRQVVNRHGGQVTVRNEGGAVFTATLPLAASREATR